MAGIIKGLEENERINRENAALGAGGNWINLVPKIRDGEYVILRFLTDTDNVITAPFHSIISVSNFGGKQTERRKLVYCTQADLGTCPYCAQGQVPSKIISLWAYVYSIYHKQQNFRLESNPEAARWPMVKVAGSNYYKEDVNAVRWFRTGRGGKGSTESMFINFGREYGTLCDRDYKWSRTGAGKTDTSYSLIPKDPSEKSPAVIEAAKDLPSLIDVVVGKTRTWGAKPVAAAESEEPVEEEEPVVEKKPAEKKAAKKTTVKSGEQKPEDLF